MTAHDGSRWLVEPRIWNGVVVSRRLGMSQSAFCRRRHELEALGFPNYDHILKGWDSVAIESWLDKRSGLLSDNPIQSSRMKDAIRLGDVRW